MNTLEKLGEWLEQAPREHSPANLQRATDTFIDTLACILSGREEAVVARVYQSIQETSTGNVSAFGCGQTSAASAALVNGTAAHSQDFDDYNRSSVAHTSAVLIPTALAISEQLQASGADCLDASIAGLEVMVYLGAVINMDHYLRGWHATATLGAVGAAAVASRLMRLDADEACAALSLATSMIGGFKLQFGTMGKPLHAGLAAQAGTNAAIMASNCITASSKVFDDEFGITSMWSDTNPAEFAATVIPESGLLAIEHEGLYVKCYPCCGYSSRGIDGMIALMQENQLKAEQIDEIEIEVPDRHATVVSYSIPQNRLEARFSFPYCLATAALHQSVTAHHFDESMIFDAPTRAMMERVKVIEYPADPALEDLSPQAPDRLRVILKNGQIYEKTMTESKGSPENPLCRKALFEKFWQCADSDIVSYGQIETCFNNFYRTNSVNELVESIRRLSEIAPKLGITK